MSYRTSRLALVGILAAGCATTTATKPVAATSTVTPCVQLAPGADADPSFTAFRSLADGGELLDYIGVRGQWFGVVLATSPDGVRIVGYAASEDSPVWNLARCAQ